jgi:MHS family proline/betaine transporter-like MFS transporter
MPSFDARRIIAAGTIGNILEWYDFAIYGYFAPAIGRTFFPSGDPVAQVLAAFGVFAVGYLMRPLGGAFVGYIGDRYGRRTALTFSVTAMAIPTFLVGALPGYQTLGIAAPVLLTLLRMIQGLSVGGECTTAFTFMVEHAPPGRRGLVGAIASCGATVGILLGSATGALFAAALPSESLHAWGWRLPFLLGLLVGLVGYLVRRHIPETSPGGARLPVFKTLRHHGAVLGRLAGLSVFGAVSFYLMFLYIVSWLQFVDGIAPARALGINTASMAAMIPAVLASGWLSDRLGRKPLLLGAMALACASAVPLFWLMHHSDPVLILLGQMGFVLTVGTVLGVQPSLMVETTPPGIRCTAIALGFNVAFGVLGGLTPLAATWLVHRTGTDLSPAFMIMVAAAISFVAALAFKEPPAALRTVPLI